MVFVLCRGRDLRLKEVNFCSKALPVFELSTERDLLLKEVTVCSHAIGDEMVFELSTE